MTRMKTYKWIHRLAISALLVMAILNVSSIIGAPKHYASPPHIIIGATLGWILFIWGLWIYPRQWGLWLGLCFVGAIPFQIYLRHLALDRAAMLRMEPDSGTTFWPFVASVMLTGAAAVLCLLLRICSSAKPPRAET
jgi:hypothetical protein